MQEGTSLGYWGARGNPKLLVKLHENLLLRTANLISLVMTCIVVLAK